MPLTLVWSMERAFGAAHLNDSTRVANTTIHIVGAELNYEGVLINKFEEILHLVPAIEHLTLVFIGPLLPQEAVDGLANLNMQLCDSCQGEEKTRKLTLAAFCGTYRDYFASSSSSSSSAFGIPDLVMAYNAGVHLFKRGSDRDSWHNTLEFLANDPHMAGVPIAVTSVRRQCSPQHVFV
jgi:hypothetical protein